MIVQDGEEDLLMLVGADPKGTEAAREAVKNYEDTCSKLFIKDPHLILKMRGVNAEYLGKLAEKKHFVNSFGTLSAIPEKWIRINE